MTTTDFPNYITDILTEWESSQDLESVLINKADLTSYDIVLYNTYIDLGYQPRNRQFLAPIELDTLKSKLYENYWLVKPSESTESEMPDPTYDSGIFLDVALHSIWSDTVEKITDTPKKTRMSRVHLRPLSVRCREMVWHKGKTTFKEVCDDLAYELVGENEGESKNIRRRVYDALNVLIATGVICK